MDRVRPSHRPWLAALLVVLGLFGSQRLDASPRPVVVDTRVELAAVANRLAGFEEFSAPGIADYDAAVETHFQRYQDHPVVQLLRALRQQHGIGYSDTVALALAATPHRWQSQQPLALWLRDTSSNWTLDTAQAYLEAMAAFERDTDAAAFFHAQQRFYRRVEAELGPGLQGWPDVAWFEQTLGPQPGLRLQIIAGLLHGRGNYGPRLRGSDGSVQMYAVLGVPEVPPGEANAWPFAAMQRLLVHEFAHSWVNPWVDGQAATLQPAATTLLGATAERMAIQAYGSWQALAYETLVRAVTRGYFQDNGDSASVALLSQEDAARGFGWVPAATDQLRGGARGGRWLNAGTAGAMAALLEAQVAQLQARAAAGVTSVSVARQVPAAGDTQVDSALAQLELYFDRPMGSGVGIFGDRHPTFTGAPRWDADRRVLRLPVALQPSREYVIELNSPSMPGGFAGKDGTVLPAQVWRFRTRALPAH
ncbi:DUF4932 domain-containing protein [Stenotrophomonas sp.]|uniref:DUF4932 domain-containing protein n=1 Tax=Stenotrophomonas sp. TaxID=69392 RepID=UPI002FC5C9D7